MCAARRWGARTPRMRGRRGSMRGPARPRSREVPGRVMASPPAHRGRRTSARRSPSCLTVCMSPSPRRAARTHWRDLDRAAAAGSWSLSSSARTSTAYDSGEPRSAGSSAPTRRRTRKRVSAISPPISSKPSRTLLAPLSSLPRWSIETEQMTRAQAAGPAPEMRSAPRPSPVFVPVGHHQQRTPSLLADPLDGLENGAHVVQVRSAGPSRGQIQRVQDNQGRRMVLELGLDGDQLAASAGELSPSPAGRSAWVPRAGTRAGPHPTAGDHRGCHHHGSTCGDRTSRHGSGSRGGHATAAVPRR